MSAFRRAMFAAEAGDFLLEASMSLRHEIRVAAGPELVSMRQRTRHAAARGLHHVLAQGLRRQRREVAVPVNRMLRSEDTHDVLLAVSAGVPLLDCTQM